MRASSTSNLIASVAWDVVVIGAGAAGLMACLELPSHLKVLLLNRNTSRRSSSRWAQGGIAAVTRDEDSLDSHAQDTINAGAGLCDGDAVRMLVQEAPACVERLQSLGMKFDKDLNQLATTLEAAHTHRRVLHVQDRTGLAIVDVLQDQVEQRSNLLHRRGVRVTQLWVEDNRCHGVQILDGPYLHWVPAKAVVLATGGGGHLFANTTNPAQACGEGIALAWSAGAVIEDLEFVQFHPTALKLPGAPCFLLTEALRGEGAVLVDQYGQSPVSHLQGADLASRDQVSRALVHAMQLQGAENMGLDLRPISSSLIEDRFPTILQRCREFGINPLTGFIPVAPAAHYWMGGVATNLNAASSLLGLYAVGEVACTGLHGANRLASNSLMECLVFARQLSKIDLDLQSNIFYQSREFTPETCSISLDGEITAESLKKQIEELRKLCWKVAGVDRSVQCMQNALTSINKDIQCLEEQSLLKFLRNQGKSASYILDSASRKNLNLLLDLLHRQLTSSLMLEACLFRRESRGGHFRNDYPNEMPFWRCHSLQQKGQNLLTREIRS